MSPTGAIGPLPHTVLARCSAGAWRALPLRGCTP
jgi:hypothetical protein